MEQKLKKFSIAYDVNGAEGSVVYTVKAKTKPEAVQMLKDGEGEITSYEVEPSYMDVDYEKDVYEGQ